MKRPQLGLVALALLSLPALAAGWGKHPEAFPIHPCSDGWAACLVGDGAVGAGMIRDAAGRPLPADARIGWFDLAPTAGLSPFTGLSPYRKPAAGAAAVLAGGPLPTDAPPTEAPATGAPETVAVQAGATGTNTPPVTTPATTLAASSPTTSATSSSGSASMGAGRPTTGTNTPPTSTGSGSSTMSAGRPTTTTTPATTTAVSAPPTTASTATMSAGRPTTGTSAPPETTTATRTSDPTGTATAPDSASCESTVELEPLALMGQLSSAQARCVEGKVGADLSQTARDKYSRVLIANAEAKGDKSEWERLVRRHLEDIDRSDPDLCYKYALQLSRGGVARAAGVIRWADYALENKQRWQGETYKKRVFALLKLRAEAGARLWEAAEKEYTTGDHTEENEAKAARLRGTAKDHAKEWLDYARSSGQDTNTALALCVSAAGNRQYCDGG